MSAALLLAEYPVVVRLEVRWGEMDAFKHVNNAVYFKYFEAARIVALERAGLFEAPGSVHPVLASTSCRFKAPLTYPDVIHVGVRIKELGSDRWVSEHAIVSERLQRIVATGEAEAVMWDHVTQAKVAIPELWHQALTAMR